MNENKLVKTVTDSFSASWIVRLLWDGLAKKALRESFIGDPSTNVMNFVKWVACTITVSYLCQKLFRESEDTTHKSLNMNEDKHLSEVLRDAYAEYTI